MAAVWIVLSIFLSCIFSSHSLAVVKGSESAVSVQALALFPAVDNDNTMLGFGWFKNGFTLEDNTTTCTFNSVYPVAGTATLNGGMLYLSDDLIFTNTANLLGGGTIIGNNHVLELSSSITALASTYTLQDTELIINGDLTIEDHVTFVGNSSIRGNDFNFDVAAGGKIFVASGATLSMLDVDIAGISDDNIVCIDDTARIILNEVLWVQNDDFTFNTGSITFQNAVEFRGSHTFFYDSSQTSTIASNSKWMVSGNMTLKVGRKEAIDYVEPIYFTDATSKLRLDDCSLIITASGIGLKKGEFELDREVYVDVLSSTTTHGLILGDGTQDNDFSMMLDSGASIHLNSGCWVYNNYASYGKLHALSPSSRCLRYGASKFYVMRDWTIPPMIFAIASGNPENVICDGVTLSYDSTYLSTADGDFTVIGGEAVPGFTLSGNDHIYMAKGALPLPVYVSGSGNTFHGNGNAIGSITLQDNLSDLCFQLNGYVSQNIVLNGGQLSLMGDFKLGQDAILTGSGLVGLSNFCFGFGTKDHVWSGDIDWTADSGSIELRSSVELTGAWKFTGTCVLDGRGNSFSIEDGGGLVVDDESKLILRNLVIRDVSGDEVRCLTDSGVIEFDNVTWVQDDHFTFTMGCMEFINNVDFMGSYSFVYDSTQTSTIAARSKLNMTEGIIFKAGRKTGYDGAEPLYFTDNTSTLKLDNCSFIITESGFKLTRGTVQMDREVSLEMLSSDTQGGLILGDGGDDIIVLFDSGAAMSFKTGALTYNNPNGNTLVASSDSARIIRYGPSKMYISQDWLMPTMTLKVHSGLPSIILADGKLLRHDNVHIVFNEVEFDFTGRQFGDALMALDGNDSLYLSKGNFEFYIYVSGSGNEIKGTGDISGLITLQDSDTDLTYRLNGSILTSVPMNGATLTLESDLHLGSDVLLSGSGDIDVASNRLFFGSVDQTWTSTLAWTGDGGSLQLDAQTTTLHGTWTFKDSCVISGNGNLFDLNGKGKLVVDSGATLVIRNLRLSGISGSQLQCLGDDSLIILDDVLWEQDGVYTFSTGALQWKHNVKMTGDSTFAYQSVQTSTLLANSTLKLDSGFTFSYDSGSAAKDLLEFIDDTSVLVLNSATLHATVTGLVLTKGKLLIKGDSNFSSETEITTDGFIIDEGISFGNGVGENDVACEIAAGSTLNVAGGSLVYRNEEQNSWNMVNSLSMLQLSPNTAFIIDETLDLGVGGLKISRQANVNVSDGKDLIGSVFMVD